MGTDLASIVVAVLTGTATSVGQQATAEIIRVGRERLWATPRGRAALEGLDSGQGGAEAREEAEAVLREEIAADPVLQYTLTTDLNASATQATGSIFINGSKVRRSQISLGPLTIHRPNTTGGMLALVSALLVVIALVIYGGAQLLGDDSSSGGGGDAVRALSAAETERFLPGVSDLPGKWGTDGRPGVEPASDGSCHRGRSDFKATERDGEGHRDLVAEFSVYACPSAEMAGQGYTKLVAELDNHGGGKEVPFPGRNVGDESRRTSYRVADGEMANPSQVGGHVMWRARVGTVVIVMHYGPVREGSGTEREAEEFMRIICDRARAAQARG